MTTENKYNGWNNYETWCINLWLDNDEGTQSYFSDLAQEHYKDAESDKYNTKLENATHSLQQAIKDYVEENNPIQDASLYSDLLNSAIGTADFYEIASNMLEDVEKEEELEEEIKAMPLNNQSPNVQALKHFQSDETQAKIDAMDDFTYWLEYVFDDSKYSANEIKAIWESVKAYLDVNMDKVKLGEQELLNNWIGVK